MTEEFDIDEVTIHDFDLPVATEHYLEMPPALVDAAAENPEVLVQLTRSQLAVVQDRMVKRVLSDRDVSIGALTQVHAALEKNARLKPEATAAGGAQQVVINFHFGEKKESLVIEGQATDVTSG